MSQTIYDPRLHYGCVQCGRSCTGWNVWLEPEVAERARQLPITLRIIEERGAAIEAVDGRLRMVRDEEQFKACGYLREDRLCSIHAEYGYTAKPKGCRQFPYLVTVLPDGSERIGASFSCTAVRTRQGPTLEGNAEEVEGLRALGLVQHEVPAVQPVVPGIDWSWEELQGFEERFSALRESQGWQSSLFDVLQRVGQMVCGGSAEPEALRGQLQLIRQVLLVAQFKPCLYDHSREFWASLDRGFMGEGDLVIPEYGWSGPVGELQAWIENQVGERFDGWFDEYRDALWFRKAHLLQGNLTAGLLMLWGVRDVLRFLTGLHAWRQGQLPDVAHAGQALDSVEMSLLAHSGNGGLVYRQMAQAWWGLSSQLAG